MSLIKETIANTIHADSTRRQIMQDTQGGSDAKQNSTFSPRDQKVLHLAQNESPSQFLYKLKTERHDYVDASEYRVLDDLYNQKGIPAELLNILTYACLKSGPNVSYRLANKILHDWLQHGVKSGAQAIEYMRKREQNKGQYQRYPNKKRVEKGTDWNKHKAKDRTDVSADDLKKFFKKLEDQTGLN
ncbi:hypothetical protein EQ500_06895 [Lactobacillus sp. XV13L]|nr:hypothetical protein [Lactobacillus sp. XV13L]